MGKKVRVQRFLAVLLSLAMVTSGWPPASIAYATEGAGGEEILTLPNEETDNTKEVVDDQVVVDGEEVVVNDQGAADEAIATDGQDVVDTADEGEGEESSEGEGYDVDLEPTNGIYDTDVAKIGEQGYATLKEAIEAAQSGDTIVLLSNVDATDATYYTNNRIPISKSLTIDGEKNTITVANRGFGVGVSASDKIDVTFENVYIVNESDSGRCVDTRGNLGSLTLDDVTLRATGQTSQPLTIGGNQSDAATVTIRNSEIITSADGDKGYAITTFNPVDMTITNGTIAGWACLNLKGASSSAGSAGSTIAIDGTNFTSTNVYAGDSNAYSLIKMEDSNITVSIDNAEIAINGMDNTQSLVGFENTNITGCTVSLNNGNKVTLNGDSPIAINLGSNTVTIAMGNQIIDNTSDSVNLDITPFIPEGAKLDENGYVVDAAIAQIGDTKYETVAEAVAAAREGDVIEVLKAGTYALPNLPNNVTIRGDVEGVVFEHAESGNVASVPNGATFKNVTFNFRNVNYHGFQHAGTINMVDCTINGKFFSYADMNFTDCTFNAPGSEASGISGSDYSMWAYAGNLTYTCCTFNGAGKFLNVYNESGTERYKVTATSCEFNSTATNKAAFNVKETSGSNVLHYTVNLTDCTTVGSFPEAGESVNNDGTLLTVISGLVQVDDRVAGGTESGGEIVVNVDGAQEYITPKISHVAKIGDVEYVTLQAALDAARTMEGDVTVTLLEGIEGYSIVRQKAGLNLTIDGAGKIINGQIIIDGDNRNAGTETLTIKNISFEGDGSNFCAGAAAFVVVPSLKTSGAPYYRNANNYAHNITVTDCSFVSTSANESAYDVVGFRTSSNGGAAYNVRLSNIQGVNLHSLAQFNATTGAVIDNCVVEAGESGVNISGGGGTYTFTHNSFLSAEGADGYGIRLQSSATVQLDGENEITAARALVLGKNNAVDGQFVVMDGKYDGQLVDAKSSGNGKFIISGGLFTEAPTTDMCAEGYYPVASDNEGYPHTVSNAVEAKLGDIYYMTFAEAVEARESDDDVITLFADIADEYTLESGALKVELNGKALTVNAAEGLLLETTVEDDVTTYTVGKAVASITKDGVTIEYTSLNAAIAAVPTDDTETTITMLTDEQVSVSGYALEIAAGKNVVLDLNGKTVTGVCEVEGTSALIRNLGTLTITDSAEGGKLIGGADSTWTWDGSDDYSGSYASNLICNEGTLTVNSGTLYNASAGSAAYAIDNYNSGKVTINGGVVDAKKASAIRLFNNNGGVLTVTDGTVGHYTSDDDCAYMGIQVMSGTNASVEVSGGTIAGAYAFYTNATDASSVTISGGLFDGYVGFAAAASDNIAISGGKFPKWVGTWGDHVDFISGGLFTVKPDAAYCAEGMCVVANEDEATKEDFPYAIGEAVAMVDGVAYGTFAEAAEVAGGEKVITLLKNAGTYTMAADETLLVAKEGKTITVKPPEGAYVVKNSTAGGVTTYTVAAADIEYTSASGVVSYKAFSSTVVSASGTYKLLKDVTSTVRIAPGILASSITVDLNGYTFTSTASDYAILLSRDGTTSAHKTFSLVDTSENGGGTLVVNSAAQAAIQVTGKYNDITIGERVTIDGGCVTILSVSQTLVVDGAINGGSDFAVATNGSSTELAAITIGEKAKLTSDKTAMYLPGDANTTVSGFVTGGITGIEIRAGGLTVNDGASVRSTYGGTPSSVANGNGTTTTGAAIAIAQHTTKLPVTVNVEGGTIEGPAAVYESNPQRNPEEDVAQIAVTLNGGVFSTTIDGGSAVHTEDCVVTIQGGHYSDNTEDTMAAVPEGKTLVKVTEGEYGGMYELGDLVTVTFDSDGGTEVEAQEIAKGGKATKPEDPTKDGKVFQGWFADGAEEAFDFENTAINEDITLTAKWEEQKLAEFTYSIALEDSIDIIYHVKNLAEDPGRYAITYSFGGDTTTKTLTKTDDNAFVVASCAAKQMTDEVAVTVKYDGRIIKEASYSTRGYCETVIGEYGSSTADKVRKTVELCKATLDYGRYAQEAFDYNTGDLANGGTDYFDNAGIAIPEAASVKDGACTGIKGTNIALVTTSKTQFSVYLKHVAGADVGDYSFELDSAPLDGSEVEDAGGKFKVTAKGIAAKDLADDHTVRVTHKDGTSYTYTASPVCYMYMAVNLGSQVEINRAFYNYYEKADAYFSMG